jgi:DNA-binding transcriptional regulator GbsR (MarR family)
MAPPAPRSEGAPPRQARERLRYAQEQAIDTCGRIAQFWGFTRTMGRTFGLLYVSPEPLTQGDVQRRLRVSAGNASMTLKGLLRWGVVEKVVVRGDRREHYRSETDFWKMISRVLNERERQEIRAAIQAMTRAEAAAGEARRAFQGADRERAEHTVRRLVALREICSVGETMLDLLLGQLSLDVAQFRDVFRRDGGPVEKT